MLIRHANMSHYFPRKKKKAKKYETVFLKKKKKNTLSEKTRNLFQKKKQSQIQPNHWLSNSTGTGYVFMVVSDWKIGGVKIGTHYVRVVVQ